MTEEPLPPFSGDNPTCPKCGQVGAFTKYLDHGRCIHVGTEKAIIGYQPNERLHRECQRCDYAWDEAITDAPTG